MRRTMETDRQNHGTLKVTQGALRHVSIATTGNVYGQTLDANAARVSTHKQRRYLKAGLRLESWDSKARVSAQP